MGQVVDESARRLAERGREHLLRLIPMSKVDGNVSGTVDVVRVGSSYSVNYDGEDVGYIEFGTGDLAKNSPYPDNEVRLEAGWEYDINKHGHEGWWYRDKLDGKIYHSIGMKPLHPVYTASERTEQDIAEIVKEVLLEKFN